MSDTVHVLVHVTARPGREDALLRLASAHAACSRLEPGCLAFEVLADPGEPALLTLHEAYRDAAALEAHRATAHYARWRGEVAGLRVAPHVRHVLVPGGTKRLEPAALPALGQAARSGGRTVALANGCWDALHAGHVHLLAEARKLADLLVVAINTDHSVRRLKGPFRPACPLADRVAVLEALACVGHVVPFGTDDELLALVASLRPDVLVKGDEPRAGPVVGADLLAGWGGRLHLVPLLPGRSTTATLGVARPAG